jgi:hypothetical protein
MPETITITKTIYTFDELDDSAKETAREWYREGALDYDWWDAVYEDAKEVAKRLGIEFLRKKHRGSNGPGIYFSGFYSQGDGACFESTFKYSHGMVRAIKEYAPQDAELHRIATQMARLQRRNFYGLYGTTEHSGHYYHSGCMRVWVRNHQATYEDVNARTEEDFTQLLRDFADWIYERLEAEYDYLMSDESVDDTIRANEYTFTESGRLEQ